MKYLFSLSIFAFFSLSLNAQFYEEGFESGIPDDWTAENAWTDGTSITLSSSSFAISDHGRFVGVNDDQMGASFNGSGRLISPMMDLSSIDDTYAISFEAYFLNSDFQGKDETAKLMASTDGGQNWQELFDMEPAFEWQRINVGLGNLAGQAEVLFAFDYDDGNGWNYGVAIDDISINQIYQRNIALTEYRIPKYVPNEGDIYMDISVLNVGIEHIESFDLRISYEGNDYVTNINSFPIKYLETYDLQVLIPFEYDITELYQYTFVIENVNGNADLDPSNNSGNLQFSTVANPPLKRTIAEEGTGTWCGWCPRGSVSLEYMEQNYKDEFVGIAVHNNDPMVLAEYDASLGITGFPGLYIDRKYVIDPGEVEFYHLENMKLVSPIGIDFSFDYNEISRSLNVYPKATVHTRLAGDYRFSIIISEDGITGAEMDYAQANYYSGGLDLVDIHGVNWRNLPDPVPASDMIYDEVGRAIIGGFQGIPMSIGSNLNNGDAIDASYNYVLPAEFDDQNIKILVVAIDAISGEVLNGIQKELFMTSSVNVWPSALSSYKLTPNPAISFANLNLELTKRSDLRIQLVNQYGALIKEENLTNQYGQFNYQIDTDQLIDGIYFVKFYVNENYLIEKLIIQK